MPRLSPGGTVGMGTGGLPGSVNLNIIPDAYGPMIVNGRTVVFQQMSDGKLYEMDINSGVRTLVSERGANDLAAGGDNWAAWLAGFGLYSKNGFNSSIAGLLDVGPDGTVGYVPDRQVGFPARANRIYTVDGQPKEDDWLISTGIVFDLQLLGDEQAIWVNERQQIITKGIPSSLQVGNAFKPRAALLNGEWWVCYWSDIKGVVLHPFNSLTGYVVVTLDFNAFNHKMIVSNNMFRVVWSTLPGELPEEFKESFIDPASPRVPLVQDEPIEKIGRRMWSGWIEHSEPPNPTLVPSYANSLMRVHDAGSIKTVSDGKFIYQWVQGSTVESIEQQCLSNNNPCFAYWDSRKWPRWPNLKPNDILALQAYCLREESPQVYERNQQAVIDSVPAHYNLGWVPQCYTSNEHLTTNLKALVPVYSRLAKKNTRIQFNLMFSDTRPTGLQDHLDVLPLWQEFHAGITGVPMADNGIENGVLVDPQKYHFSLVQGLVLDGTDATLVHHLNNLKDKWYKYGFGMQHGSGCNARPRLYFPTAICPNASPNMADPNEVCLGVKQDPKCWDELGRRADITNHPPTEWIWDEAGPQEYQPITPVNPPIPGPGPGILIFGYTNPTRRSDPLGCHILYEAAGDRPVKSVTINLVGSGMEPKVQEYPIFPGNDGRFWRGANVKLTHEGTWDLQITATDDAGNSNSVIAGRITVLP